MYWFCFKFKRVCYEGFVDFSRLRPFHWCKCNYFFGLLSRKEQFAAGFQLMIHKNKGRLFMVSGSQIVNELTFIK